MVTVRKYLLTSGILVCFFVGRVPWYSCEWVRRKSGHSCCVACQAARLVKGILAEPSMTSLTDKLRTTVESASVTNLHIWHDWSLHSLGCLLAWSDGRLAAPEMCLTCTWYLLTVARKVLTRELAENSPRQSLL